MSAAWSSSGSLMVIEGEYETLLADHLPEIEFKGSSTARSALP
jgi:hypothetical protein